MHKGCSLTDCRNPGRFVVKAAVFCMVLLGACGAQGQARATATEVSRLSVFLGANGTLTRLNGGRTAGITGGADLAFRPFYSFQPSIEVRGTLALFKGKVDSQKNVLGGIQIARPMGRFKPYVDGLFGRGEINYHGGFPDPTSSFTYFRTVSNVISAGAGVDFEMNHHVAVKADAQYQRYDTPVTNTGKLGSRAGMVAVVYRFDFNRSPRNIR